MAFKVDKNKNRETGYYNQRGTAMLNDVRQFTTDLLTEAGIHTDVSEQISNELMNRLATHWGGQLLYFGHGHVFSATKRDEKIYAKFNGHNHAELAKEFSLGVVYIYTIVKRMKKLERDRVQPDMFAGDEDES